MAVISETNVTMSSIRDTLNAAGGSVGNNLESFFTEEAKINKWARFKPESYPKDFNLTKDERASNHYGLQMSTYGSLFGGGQKPVSGRLELNADYNGFLYKLCKGTLGQFKHILPTGGASSPYRLGDFRRYNSEAVNPLPMPTEGTYKYTDVGAVDIPLTVATPSVEGLTLDLLSATSNLFLSGMYFGIVMYNDDLTDVIFGTQTADQKSKGRNVVTLKNTTYATITDKKGAYKAKAFFSNVPIELNDVMGANPSVLLGDDEVEYSVVIVPAYETGISLTKEYKIISSTKIRLVVNVTNNTASAVTVTSCKFKQSDSVVENNANNVPLTIAAWDTKQVYFETAFKEGDSFTATLVIDGNTYTV